LRSNHPVGGVILSRGDACAGMAKSTVAELNIKTYDAGVATAARLLVATGDRPDSKCLFNDRTGLSRIFHEMVASANAKAIEHVKTIRSFTNALCVTEISGRTCGSRTMSNAGACSRYRP